ncbi:HNH endonuclease [Ralstonia pickettii]|uniref:HNH endonuclease n=1 Tax=Ralstonia pickettii TaxID=329 RepID=UPI0026B980BF
MDYYAFNIDKPATSEWWAQNIARGVITVGFDGKPQDRGAVILQNLKEGDWVLAFANGRGFVGAGRVREIGTYQLHPSIPSDSLSDHRHERGVDWVHYVRDVKDAVTVASIDGHAPRQTRERLRNHKQAERIIALLSERSSNLSERGYRCELWGTNGWRTVPVTYALARPEAIVRCRECHGSVRLHVAGPKGIPRAHAEHRIGHPGCSLGHYFNGTRTPHPSPVVAPSDAASTSSDITVEDDESAFPEGRESFKLHRHLERDQKLPRRLKECRLRETGKLECEVCSFDFTATYGSVGEGFIEAHHRTPVHQLNGKQKTKAIDLALVCSNCHRMLHRADPQLRVEELRARLLAKPK